MSCLARFNSLLRSVSIERNQDGLMSIEKMMTSHMLYPSTVQYLVKAP